MIAQLWRRLELLELFSLVVSLSASGVFSPGPLFFITVENALKSGGRSGWIVALGHMSFEFPLVLGLAYGIWSFLANELVRFAIGLSGAVAIIIFGVLQAYSSYRGLTKGNNLSTNYRGFAIKGSSWFLRSFLVGLTFTGLNPYFLIWWFTIGLSLITYALELASILGVFIMYSFHIWMDYVFLGAVSHLTAAGGKVLKTRHLHMISLALSMMLIGIGGWILAQTITSL